MMKYIFIAVVFIVSAAHAQVTVKSGDNEWKKMYRAEATKINDLVHTKLDVRFDFSKAYMYGKEWLTLKPHFYATDSLSLDAKGMHVNEVAMMKAGKKISLKYSYDSMMLNILLDRSYKGGENYTIYIDYISKPNEFKAKGSAAITDAKGLYFINPKGDDKEKPTQIWTQGETESNSVWMPTIDKPNQKTTAEISMTVPAKYVTLSNGLLVNQKKNTDGTRTDTWKMDLPHAPYLFFMGAGEYAVVKDFYKGKEVSYYVEKEYAPVARKIFGNTPEMIKFFAEKLGVEYAWPKYAQIVGRDYVSGAMENTTSTLHGEYAYQNARELLDENKWEPVIAHELFHQWFGDLVTCESWSNLTVNESFADFSETLWAEYKYGKDAGDETNYVGRAGYLGSFSQDLNLVRFYYKDKEDMFDAVSYSKGGRILNMLRNYVGEDAFFKSLNKYLTDNKFKSGEAQQLRLAFEAVTGKDLNWFWNQWYYGSGHPVLSIQYKYDDAAGKATVIMKQTQQGNVFKLPVAIDVYNGADKKRYNVWMTNKTDSFVFNYTKRPDLINVDGDKILLCEKTDNKTADNFIAQMKYAPLYSDRREAYEYFAKNQMPQLKDGLKDKYPGLRQFVLEQVMNDSTMLADESVQQTILQIAEKDADRKTRAKAIEALGYTEDEKYKTLFEKNVTDSSYSVAGASLNALNYIDSAKAYTYLEKLMPAAKGDLANAIGTIVLQAGDLKYADFAIKSFVSMPPGEEKFAAITPFCTYLQKIDDNSKVKLGIDEVIKFKKAIPEAYRGFTEPVINGLLQKIAEAKGNEIADYIKTALQ